MPKDPTFTHRLPKDTSLFINLDVMYSLVDPFLIYCYSTHPTSRPQANVM